MFKPRRMMIGALALGLLGACEFAAPEATVDQAAAPSPEVVVAPSPEVVAAPSETESAQLTVSDVADRVFYLSKGSREWGSLCRLPGGGHASVHHVTVNGTPAFGPQAPVTASDELADWSFVGVDPLSLNADDYPELTAGMDVMIAGYPATDRDGEFFPGRVYLDDPEWPYVWVELTKRDDGSHPEGVVGGVSGSCGLHEGAPVAVTSANGFSVIEGTTNTWAKVVPIRRAILMAQGKGPPTSFALVALDDRPRPQLHTGRYALRE